MNRTPPQGHYSIYIHHGTNPCSPIPLTPTVWFYMSTYEASHEHIRYRAGSWEYGEKREVATNQQHHQASTSISAWPFLSVCSPSPFSSFFFNLLLSLLVPYTLYLPLSISLYVSLYLSLYWSIWNPSILVSGCEELTEERGFFAQCGAVPRV